MKQFSSVLTRQFSLQGRFIAVAFLLASCANLSQPTAETTPPPTVVNATPQPTQTATPQPQNSSLAVQLTPVPQDWRENTHIHGMAVHPERPEVLYLATHHGLFVRSQPEEWAWVGSGRDDLMGFVADPVNPQRFYSSGHPPTGGNLGFRVSEDHGQTWKLVSMKGADFHALAIAPSAPDTLYGWASTATGEHGFFASEDGGQTWTEPQLKGLTAPPFSVAVHPTNPNQVFATTELGLFTSADGGDSWTLIASTENIPIAGLAVAQSEAGTTLYGYQLAPESTGFYRSQDTGKTWEKVGKGLEGTILYVAIAPNNPQILYAANQNNSVFQSQDGGVTWTTVN